MGSDSGSAAEVVVRFIVAILAWAVVLMAASLVFTLAWNGFAPSVFGLTRVTSLESLCLLSCVWILSRMAVPRFVMETRS